MGTCVDCAKGKLTKAGKKSATRSEGLLELVHTDISGPYSSTLCGKKYFVTFIDDFSRYGYLYLIKEKFDALEMFKTYKTKIEKQLGKVTKIVRSNPGCEYYGKYDEEDSKGFKFYCPTRGTRIVKALTAKFLELDMAESSCPQPSETIKSRKSVSIPLPSLTETLLVALTRKEIVTLAVQNEDPRIPVIEVPEVHELAP
ncbi:Retrovirus-related Pol polyprotein from transposon TNT 1-94 [Senna tora]|uniref:Retrovirus-related Pol polyprotein from transposon TNT 1-94 n=1 Tax=Senna tora TaxID=362788 RepID=A0A834WQZ5_9FABA|nr:Retrovirus-related Pol polyprotein from transposon TNT 1-94 [Senna tora]